MQVSLTRTDHGQKVRHALQFPEEWCCNIPLIREYASDENMKNRPYFNLKSDHQIAVWKSYYDTLTPETKVC
jgi:hypothetical protein